MRAHDGGRGSCAPHRSGGPSRGARARTASRRTTCSSRGVSASDALALATLAASRGRGPRRAGRPRQTSRAVDHRPPTSATAHRRSLRARAESSARARLAPYTQSSPPESVQNFSGGQRVRILGASPVPHCAPWLFRTWSATSGCLVRISGMPPPRCTERARCARARASPRSQRSLPRAAAIAVARWRSPDQGDAVQRGSHHARTSEKRRVASEPKSALRESFACVVAGLVSPHRKRAAWRA